MRVATMRKIDRWLGVPACAALTLARRLFDPARPDEIARPGRILFVKLAEQGSSVLASQAIRRAIAKVGPGNVYVLVFEENRHILNAMALIPEANIVTIPATTMRAVCAGTIRAIRRLRQAEIDTAIDLEFFARSSAALAYLSGARWRVGFHPFGGEAAYRGDLLTHRLSFNSRLHTTQTFDMLVAALDQPPAMLPALDFDARTDEHAVAQREARHLAGERIDP